MRRSHFSEEERIKAVLEYEAGATRAEICQRYHISEATFYNWKSKKKVADLASLEKYRMLEDENLRLKKILAEFILEYDMMKKNHRLKKKDITISAEPSFMKNY